MSSDEYKEYGLAMVAGVNEEHINEVIEQYDEYYNLVFLLHRVNEFQPRDKWIIPILKSHECSDFKTQLLTAVEDHEKAESEDSRIF